MVTAWNSVHKEMNMTLKEIMGRRNWVVLGDTLNEEKYAYRIKQGLIEKGFVVECVGKEKASIDEVEMDIEVVDLCIHPVKGLKLLMETGKDIPCVLIQPGAGSEEIESYLEKKGIPFLNGCALKGMEAYCK